MPHSNDFNENKYFWFNGNTGSWDELTNVNIEIGGERPIYNYPDLLVDDTTVTITLDEPLNSNQVGFIQITGYQPGAKKPTSTESATEESSEFAKIWSDRQYLYFKNDESINDSEYFCYTYGDL